MDKQVKTWNGMLSNLGDQWKRFVRLIGDAGVFDLFKDKLAGLLSSVNQMAASGELKQLATDIGKGLVEAAKAAFAVMESLGGAFRAAGDAGEWLSDNFRWLLPLGKKVADIAATIWEAWGKVAGAIGAAASTIDGALSSVGKFFGISGGDESARPSPPVAAQAIAAAGTQRVGGKMEIEIKSDRPVEVKKVQSVSPDFDIEADTGLVMVGG